MANATAAFAQTGCLCQFNVDASTGAYVSMICRGAEHLGITDGATNLSQCRTENNAFNNVDFQVFNNLPSLQDLNQTFYVTNNRMQPSKAMVTQATPVTGPLMKTNFAVQYSWSGADMNRILTVNITGPTLSSTDITNAKAWIAANYPGRIVLQNNGVAV